MVCVEVQTLASAVKAGLGWGFCPRLGKVVPFKNMENSDTEVDGLTWWRGFICSPLTGDNASSFLAIHVMVEWCAFSTPPRCDIV